MLTLKKLESENYQKELAINLIVDSRHHVVKAVKWLHFVVKLKIIFLGVKS